MQPDREPAAGRTGIGPSPHPLSVYLVAGEESGDALGGALARALLELEHGSLRLAGIGGQAMAAAGIESLFPINELSIIGLTAIPRHLPMILRRIRQAADAIVAARPDALVIIDSPDFTHRVARLVRRRAPAVPILDYVSPSVWAWRPGRARAMRAYVDCVLAILPFEPCAHKRLGGPPCRYIGHPLIERTAELRPSAAEQERRGSDPPVLLVLPGSRAGEIRRLLPIFRDALAALAGRFATVDLVLPTMPHLVAQIRDEIAAWPQPPRIVIDRAEKWAAFRTARVALVASGTVTLELALAGVPMVAAYRVPPVEELAFRTLLAPKALRPVESVILANLVLGASVVPEFLQGDCSPAKLADALSPLLLDSLERRRQVEAFARLDAIMAIGAGSPSGEAAAAVLDFARHGRRNPAPA